MADSINVHLVQFEILWEDRERNFAAVDRLLTHASIRPGDVVVLPEMFDSGFSLNTEITRDADGATLRFLLELADDLDAIVVGGRTVHDCDCALADNRCVVAAPGQRLVCEYAKIHPFSFGREHEKFGSGGTVEVARLPARSGRGREGDDPPGWMLCPTICYDLRFPELYRRGLALGADLFTVIANWPSARTSHWDQLLIARAIENQAYVVGVNRVGRDPHLAYSGSSAVIDPKGRVVERAGDEECVLSVPLDRGLLESWRAEFPAWRDARLLGSLQEEAN